VGTVLLADSTDPFAGNLSALVPIQTNKATGRTISSSALLSVSGPAARLPAGDVQATVEGEFVDVRLRSTTDFLGVSQKRTSHRSEWSLRGIVEVPLASAAAGVLPGLGELSANAEATLADFSDAGTLEQYALGLTWVPRPRLRFRGEYEKSESPPAISLLGDPVIVTSGVRTFDPLTGETVDVTQITGGNPDLDAEKTTTWTLSGLWTAVPRHNLQLSATYTDTDERNFVSSVPDASQEVMLALPTRFVRDLDGTLTLVDLRPINFDSHRAKRLRYGFSLSTTIAGGRPTAMRAAGPAGEETGDQAEAASAPSSRPLRFQLSANHSIVFQDKISIRPGFDSVNLLEGGAIGIAGGRVRHQLDGTAALTSGGLGMRLNANWRGKYTLESSNGGTADTLRFSPVFLLNLRAFADMRRFLPDEKWARGMRVSLGLYNATNERQEVRDSNGNTPLQYQPGYRDPIGRTVEFELRKVF
jgi:outer membrane receptor protein involved in Fe transport